MKVDEGEMDGLQNLETSGTAISFNFFIPTFFFFFYSYLLTKLTPLHPAPCPLHPAHLHPLNFFFSIFYVSFSVF